MESIEKIKSSTLQISGIFSRLKSGHYTVEKVTAESLRLTMDIDKSAEDTKDIIKSLRVKNAKLCKERYIKDNNISKLKNEVKSLKDQLKTSQQKITVRLMCLSHPHHALAMHSDNLDITF